MKGWIVEVSSADRPKKYYAAGFFMPSEAADKVREHRNQKDEAYKSLEQVPDNDPLSLVPGEIKDVTRP